MTDWKKVIDFPEIASIVIETSKKSNNGVSNYYCCASFGSNNRHFVVLRFYKLFERKGLFDKYLQHRK